MSAEMDHFERKSRIDKMAAVFILQGYLDSIRNSEEEADDDIIILEDDDGSETEFKITDDAVLDGVMYVFAVENGKENGQKCIFKETEDEDGDIFYELVEDEKELEKAENIFKK